MKKENKTFDIVVIGGGLSGICAAIAAARLGRSVALIQNRPVLGGNSSSEVRVWVGGANALTNNRYARENGIMGELFLENQYRNPEGNPYLWDLVLLDAARAEPNIQLFLNTDVREVDADGEWSNRRIRSVTGWMMGAEREITFKSEIFLDCSGDALIGFLSGAQWRRGREARSETGEPWAPEVADDLSLGSTILFYTKDAGEPVRFVPPSFVKNIAETSIPLNRIIRTGEHGASYWWIEFGGTLDTLHDDAEIRDELWSVVYGIWDYIKNSGKFDAANLTLEWVGSIPGKRESRRLEGDYLFNQFDVMRQTMFEDRIGFGGWMVDLHPPEGMYSSDGASLNMYANGVFHIPYRSLYSANVSNLLLAGRNVSATRAGLGALRVMATCGVMGEAAGTAAALCVSEQLTPRELGSQHITKLQRTMLKYDGPILGLRLEDENDLAQNADLFVSSWVKNLAVEEADDLVPLSDDIGVLLPVDPRIEHIDLLMEADAGAVVAGELWSTERPENYVPFEKVASASVTLKASGRQWVRFPLAWAPVSASDCVLIIKQNAGVTICVARRPHTGVLMYKRNPNRVPNQFHIDGTDEYPPLVLEWDIKTFARTTPCLRVSPETEAYSPEKIRNGLARPFGGPNVWSAYSRSGPVWVELQWNRDVEFNEVHLTFNDNVHEHLNNLHRYRTPFEIMPELVRSYRLEAMSGNIATIIAAVDDNRKRHRIHRFETPVTADRLRLVINSTNGAPFAELYDLRIY